MAVLPTLPGIEAVVLINGVAAQEYDDNDEVHVEHEDNNIAEYQAAHTISKYIQSETDQTFTIRLTVGSPYVKGKYMAHVRLNFHVYVDGAKVSDPWCSRLDFKNFRVGKKWVREVEGLVEKNGKKVKPFIFAGITTNSDAVATAEVKRLRETMKKVGVIEIRVNSATAGSVGGHGIYPEKDLALQDNTDVPENALKGDAKTHGTTLGDAKRAEVVKKNLNNRDNAPDYPEVIFRFLYRDEESLRQLWVMERTPSLSSSRSASPETDRSVSLEPGAGSSLREELEALLAKVKEGENATAARRAARRETSGASGASRAGTGKSKGKGTQKKKGAKSEVGVKREREISEEQSNRGSTANKRRKIHPGVIDLTGEDNDDDDADENESAASVSGNGAAGGSRIAGESI